MSVEPDRETLPVEATAPLPAVVPMLGLVSARTELVHCPECGQAAMVALNARDASDFCQSCDFPLFWAVSRVTASGPGTQDESLRRLPGTVGRVTVASLRCPHCAEPNLVAAVDCVRCGLSLHPVAAPPPEDPAPVARLLPLPPAPRPSHARLFAVLAVLAFIVLVAAAWAARYWLG